MLSQALGTVNFDSALSTTQMAVYAAQVDSPDQSVGRILEALAAREKA